MPVVGCGGCRLAGAVAQYALRRTSPSGEWKRNVSAAAAQVLGAGAGSDGHKLFYFKFNFN